MKKKMSSYLLSSFHATCIVASDLLSQELGSMKDSGGGFGNCFDMAAVKTMFLYFLKNSSSEDMERARKHRQTDCKFERQYSYGYFSFFLLFV